MSTSEKSLGPATPDAGGSGMWCAERHVTQSGFTFRYSGDAFALYTGDCDDHP